MQSNRQHWSRRVFLGGAAGVALLPFVPLPTYAAGEPPRRLILMVTHNGVVQSTFWPTGTETDFTLGTSQAALEPFRDHLIYPKGMRYNWSTIGGHQGGFGIMWTGCSMTGTSQSDPGFAKGPSVDQVVAAEIGAETPYGSLEFAVLEGSAKYFYAAASQPIPSEPDPFAMFDRIFGDFTLDDSELQALRARRASVLDVVKDDLTRLDAQLPGEDRVKTEAHLDAIRSLEDRLDSTLAAGCQIPDLGDPIDTRSHELAPELSRLQIDLMVMALACGLTRVASLNYGMSTQTFPSLGIYDPHHMLSHMGSQATTELTAINGWHAEQLAYLLAALQAVPEGEGTMLDNTMIVTTSEVAVGDHDAYPIPNIIAGGGGGLLSGGRFIDYGDLEHNRLLVTILHVMGLTDVETFGDLDVGSGPLPGLL